MSHNALSMTALLQDVVALLAITNPLGALPVFLAITEGLAAAERSRAGLRAGFAATMILAVAAVAGKPILRAFGISMPALQAAGGLVVVLMGLEMLRGAPTRVQHDPEPQSAADQLLVPLAMPLLAGPGAIATVIALASRDPGWRGTTVLLLAVVVVGAAISATLAAAPRLGRLVGHRGQRILLRFMGLILAAVGAEVRLSGIYTFAPPS
jgi:multiple antibiotic resistance protein